MSIINYLETIEDPRSDINKKHNLIDVVFLSLSAVLSGADGWKSIQEFGERQIDWLKEHREFKHGIPKRHCIAKIIKCIDTSALLYALMDWINTRRTQTGQSHIAIDGKVMKKSWAGNIHNALQVVSAYDVDNGLSLYQQSAQSKGVEGDTARQVIEMLTLKGNVVSMDALHCQSETLNLIKQKKGDFVIQVKANQGLLHRSIQAQFDSAYPTLSDTQEHIQSNRGHGREEHREVMQIKANLPKELKTKWPHINTIIQVDRKRNVSEESPWTSHYYVSSLDIDPKRIADIIRGHWHIENKLHWVLDVVFNEDDIIIKDPDGAKHIAMFNRVCLNIIRQHTGTKDSLKSKRRAAAWDPTFRTELLFG
ncbi:MAG: ISAs1 family transposase [Pseudomonadota bacterium]